MSKIVYRQYGGKASIAKWVSSHFPPHRVYLEPFCGSCAVLLAKPRSFVEIVNDLDGRLIAMYRTLRERPQEFAAMLWATPYSPEEWRSVGPAAEAVEDGRLLCAQGVQFYNGNGNSSTWAIDATAAAHKPKADVWADWARRVLPFAARMKTVQILNEDAVTAIERVSDDPEALIYADPPYLGHEKEYRFQVDYSRFVAAALASKAKVVVSEYEEAVPLFPGWHVVRLETAARCATGAARSAKTKTECLMFNFKPAVGPKPLWDDE